MHLSSFREDSKTHMLAIVCEAERNPPKNAYLELDAHPAIITPYTPIEEIANKPAVTIQPKPTVRIRPATSMLGLGHHYDNSPSTTTYPGQSTGMRV